jgi:ubiquinone/menaquinone biosynthesis C-methylase UbiE
LPPAQRSSTSSDVQFDGSIPEIYDRFLGPLLFEPFARDLARRMAAIKPRNVLEIAAGTGIVTRRLLEALPTSTITVTDLNEPMLARARQQLGEDQRVRWRQADALDLPFSDEEFDAIVCQFGLMFFPDKLTAMREFHRVLKPSGHVLLNVWDSLESNPHGRISHAAIAESFPVDPPAFYEVPFSFHDVAEIRKLMLGAGFTSVAIETLELTGESPSAAAAARGLVGGNPCINVIMERGPERVAEIERLTAERLTERYGDDPLRIPMRAHVVSAVKAG